MAADVEPSSFGDQAAAPVADTNSETSTLDAIVDRWPIGPRSASVALQRHTVMTLPAIVLLAIASPICLVLGVLTLIQTWAAWDMNMVPPIVGYLLILAGVTVPCALTIQIRRRRRVIRVGRRLQEVGMAICPCCGSNPFNPGTCCRRAPVGWSPLDLYGFWHEGTVQRAPLDVRLSRRASNRIIAFGPRRDRLGDADFEAAWNRPRGPYGTSLARPAANPAATTARLLGRWWTTISPLFFVLLAIFVLPPAVFAGGGALSPPSWIFFGIVLIGGIAGLFVFLRRLRDRTESGLLTAPRCNACRYRLHPPFPDPCPECGVDILTAQDVTLIPYRVE